MFTPTKEMIDSAKAVFMAMAWTQTVKPIVRGYQKKVLEVHQFTNKGDIQRLSKRFPEMKEEVITDPGRSYSMSDEDFQIYLRDCNEERKKAGLKVENEEQCPLLVAEHLQMKAENYLIDVMQPITKIKGGDIWNLEHREKLLDLTLRLLAPFCKDVAQGLKQ